MKTLVAVLISNQAYKDYAEESCRKAGLDHVMLPWTGDVEEDIANVRDSQADVLLVQLHSVSYGPLVARKAQEKLAVETVFVTSVRDYREFPCFNPTWNPGLQEYLEGPRLFIGYKAAEKAVSINNEAIEKAKAQLENAQKQLVEAFSLCKKAEERQKNRN